MREKQQLFRRRRPALLAASVIAGSLLLFGGCSKGSNFEGKWIAIEKSFWDGTKKIVKLETVRNGENFIINLHNEGYNYVPGQAYGKRARWGASKTETASATLRDGKLVVNPFAAFTYIKKDGTILGPGGEVYRKETQDQFQRLKKEAAESYLQQYPGAVIEQ